MTTGLPAASNLHACVACQAPLGPIRWVCAACQAPLHPDCQARADRCPAVGCGACRWAQVDRRAGRGERVPLRWIVAVLLGATAVGASSFLHLTLSEPPRQPVLTQPVRAPVPMAFRAGQLPDLSHVLAGQQWVFHQDSSGVRLEQVYRVLSVRPDGVSCTLLTRFDIGNGMFMDAGEQPFEWTALPPLPAPPGTAFEQVTAGGTTWLCQVSNAGGAKSWVPLLRGLPTFPPHIKTESSQATSYLAEVRPPPPPLSGGG